MKITSLKLSKIAKIDRSQKKWEHKTKATTENTTTA